MPRVDDGQRGPAPAEPVSLRVPVAPELKVSARTARDRAGAAVAALAALAAVALSLAGCSQAPEPSPVAPPESFRPPPTDRAAAAPPAEVEPAEDPTLVLVDPPVEPEEEPLSLAEAARLERERRAEAGRPRIVITDRNLQEHARGELTFVEAEPESEAEEGEGAAEDAAGGEPGGVGEERGERYWRQRVRTLRIRWRDTEQSIGALEAQAAELRNRFYAEDDGYYRDSQIKPQWDRALAAVDAARREVEELQAELRRALDEGRRAGALPGWLRDGIDLEPRPAPEKKPIHEPGEPEIYDGGAVDP